MQALQACKHRWKFVKTIATVSNCITDPAKIALWKLDKFLTHLETNKPWVKKRQKSPKSCQSSTLDEATYTNSAVGVADAQMQP